MAKKWLSNISYLNLTEIKTLNFKRTMKSTTEKTKINSLKQKLLSALHLLVQFSKNVGFDKKKLVWQK